MLCSSSLKAIRSRESAVEIKLSLWAQRRFSGPCWLAIDPASPPLFSFRNIWVGSNCNKIQARRDTHTRAHKVTLYAPADCAHMARTHTCSLWQILHIHKHTHNLYSFILISAAKGGLGLYFFYERGHTERNLKKQFCLMLWDETFPSHGIKSTLLLS